jgi:hypothetical protein
MDYEVGGPAEPLRVRTAALIDLAIGTLLAVLAWPFPVARILTTDLTGSVALGWALHVAMLSVFAAVASWLYAAFCSALLHRTAGMYLKDLGYRDGSPGLGPAFGVALAWTGAGIAGLFGGMGPSASFGGGWLGSTTADVKAS